MTKHVNVFLGDGPPLQTRALLENYSHVPSADVLRHVAEIVGLLSLVSLLGLLSLAV